jgi:hypothetical protein
MRKNRNRIKQEQNKQNKCIYSGQYKVFFIQKQKRSRPKTTPVKAATQGDER